MKTERTVSDMLIQYTITVGYYNYRKVPCYDTYDGLSYDEMLDKKAEFDRLIDQGLICAYYVREIKSEEYLHVGLMPKYRP